jgi:hypothetical protein
MEAMMDRDDMRFGKIAREEFDRMKDVPVGQETRFAHVAKAVLDVYKDERARVELPGRKIFVQRSVQRSVDDFRQRAYLAALGCAEYSPETAADIAGKWLTRELARIAKEGDE